MDLQALEKLLSSPGMSLGSPAGGDSWQSVKAMCWAYLPGIVSGIGVVVTFWILANIGRRIVRRTAARRHWRPEAESVTAQSVRWAVLGVGLITGLATMGINVAALLVGLGLAGLAVVLACKDILANSLAGVLIMAYEPFARNDRIAVASLEGTVAKIDLRYTTLKTDEGRVLIPNANLLTSAVSVIAERA